MEKVVIGTKECRAEIAFLGAQLESLQSPDGREYLWQRDPKWWSGCAPVLFPMVGALRQGRTVIEGRIYEMPQHGLARREQHAQHDVQPVAPRIRGKLFQHTSPSSVRFFATRSSSDVSVRTSSGEKPFSRQALTSCTMAVNLS